MSPAVPGPAVPRPDERTTAMTRLRRWFAHGLIRDDAHRIAEIKWRWRQACEGSGLARLSYTPSGPTSFVPMIGKVHLGPPTRFAVRLLPGQLPSDLDHAAPRLAAAMTVSAINVTTLTNGWLLIELQPFPTTTGTGSQPAAA